MPEPTRAPAALLWPLLLCLAGAAPRKEHPQPKAGPPWQQLGTLQSAVPGKTSAYNPSLAVDTRGNIFIAWDEDDGASRNIYVRRWDGKAFRPLGGALSAVSTPGIRTDASRPSLAVDGQGRPTVAWAEFDGAAGNIYVATWQNNAWKLLGSALSAEPGRHTDGFSPSLALDAHDTPYVAWSESDGKSINVYVKRWDGQAWQPLGEALSALPGITHAHRSSLALGEGGPRVAWTESGPDTKDVHVEAWDGSAWHPLGGALSAVSGEGTDASGASLALDADGAPLVAWSEFDGTARNIYVRRWDGKSWAPLGEALSGCPGQTDARYPSLGLHAGRSPYVAWTEYEGVEAFRVYSARWEVGAWHLYALGLSALPGHATDATTVDLAFEPSGAPVLAWSEIDPEGVAHVTVWRRVR